MTSFVSKLILGMDEFLSDFCDYFLFINFKTDTVSGLNKSSAVAEMGDLGHNRHGWKRGELLCPFRRG